MPAEDKDLKLGDRFEEVAKVCKDFLTQVQNLQQEVSQRDDTTKSLEIEVSLLKTSIDRNKEKMNEKELIISRLHRENKLLENRLEAAEQKKNLRDSHALSKVQPSNNLKRRNYNQRNEEIQELQEQLPYCADEINRFRSRLETLERKVKDLERHIQQMSANSNPIVHKRQCNDHVNNSGNFGGCIRNASHHRIRANGSSNYRCPCGDFLCPNMICPYRVRSISNGGTSETAGESCPVSTTEISSSSSGIETDTTDRSDRSSRGTKRRIDNQTEEAAEGSVRGASEESSDAKKFAPEFPDNSPEPIDPRTCNVSTPSQPSKQNPSTDHARKQKTDSTNNSDRYISDDTDEEFLGFPTPPTGENTNQRTSAEKPTVEALPSTLMFDDFMVMYDEFNPYAGPLSSTKKPGPSGFTKKPGPSSSTKKPGPSSSTKKPGDDSDSESDCSCCGPKKQ